MGFLFLRRKVHALASYWLISLKLRWKPISKLLIAMEIKKNPFVSDRKAKMIYLKKELRNKYYNKN